MNSPEFWRIYTCVQQIKYALLCSVPSLEIYDEATTGTQRGEYIINIRETRLNYWRFSVPNPSVCLLVCLAAIILAQHSTVSRCIINAWHNEIHARLYVQEETLLLYIILENRGGQGNGDGRPSLTNPTLSEIKTQKAIQHSGRREKKLNSINKGSSFLSL